MNRRNRDVFDRFSLRSFSFFLVFNFSIEQMSLSSSRSCTSLKPEVIFQAIVHSSNPLLMRRSACNLETIMFPFARLSEISLTRAGLLKVVARQPSVERFFSTRAYKKTSLRVVLRRMCVTNELDDTTVESEGKT